MDSSRKYPRTKLNIRCRLIGSNGEDYTASLVDISFSGALLNADTETRFNVGDLCDMVLIFKSEERPTKRTCEIVRLESKDIGVKFFSKLPATHLEF